MTWEDDALSAYAQNKGKTLEENRAASQRTQLLDRQSIHQWNALVKAFEDASNRLNSKSWISNSSLDLYATKSKNLPGRRRKIGRIVCARHTQSDVLKRCISFR